MSRGRETSRALTEIRTVRSRAVNAREAIGGPGKELEWDRVEAFYDGQGDYQAPGRRRYRDPDADEMVALLDDFIEKTKKFARTGR